jgi:hypothetical protein
MANMTVSVGEQRGTQGVPYCSMSKALVITASVAEWAIANMQDRIGYFCYRRYSSRLVSRTLALRCGQSTSLCPCRTLPIAQPRKRFLH